MDRNFFEKALERWEELAIRGLRTGEKAECDAPDVLERIIVAGMGGSGIVGDFLSDLANHYSWPFEVLSLKDDRIPFRPREGDLIFVVSYSGNTLETLSVFNQSCSASRCIIVTSGGELLSRSIASGKCSLRLSEGLLPRLDLPEILYSILSFLTSNYKIPNIKAESLEDSIVIFKEDLKHQVNELAKRFLISPPILIASRPYFSVAIRLKNDLAENSKLYSSIEFLPEAAHNVVEALPYIGDPNRIFIVTGKYSWGNIYIEAFSKALNGKTGYIELKGDSLLQELIYGYRLSAYISLELSSLRGFNPCTTENIDKYKEELGRVLSH
jgi:glucose/mannose-6-phosphate isomerase